MPLGTLDSAPPPFFKQGPSAFSKLVFFSAFSVLLMVADLRLGVSGPLRQVVAVAVYPLQWLVLQPVMGATHAAQYLQSLSSSQAREADAQYQLGLQSQRAQQVEQLSLENARLRALMGLRERVNAPALAAQVLFDAADPYSRKLVIDKGSLAAVQEGAPVLDEFGVLGQVTRVYPMVSEVTLITDARQSIPILNARSGVRGVAYGDPIPTHTALELRFMDAHVDVQAGDLLTTSGIDGVFPPGLAVAKVAQIERQADSAFARIRCEPVAKVSGALHVLVLQPVALAGLSRPETPAPASKAGAHPGRRS
jgi:rod shape-determining protein MreC